MLGIASFIIFKYDSKKKRASARDKEDEPKRLDAQTQQNKHLHTTRVVMPPPPLL